MAIVPVDVVIVGTALQTEGFTANNTIAGLGLMTFGFLWPCDGIWGSSEDVITTTWVPASVPSSDTEVCLDDNGGLYA